MNPIVVWIQPDVSDLTVWCPLVYAIFLHLVMENLICKTLLHLSPTSLSSLYAVILALSVLPGSKIPIAL